ncbi:MAG: helix-turn-helix domain-containing protein, partial [Syntrophales bacterium]|nr:helix-turn-helix domain-containing protein [Syntrophales bacterium]
MNHGKNYYEILEISPNASFLEIRRAFQEAFELYSDTSLAIYSFFPEEERRAILQSLEEAYTTLINPTSRLAYDAGLMAGGVLKEEDRYRQHVREPLQMFKTDKGNRSLFRTAATTTPEVKKELSRPEDIPCHAGVLTGGDLKRLRQDRGKSREIVAAETKIRLKILEDIEED